MLEPLREEGYFSRVLPGRQPNSSALLSEVIRDTRRRVIGETHIHRTNETGVVRIGRSAEEPACAGPDLVPLDVVEPAILVGAAADWEHEGEGGGPAVRFVAKAFQTTGARSPNPGPSSRRSVA